MKPIRAPIRSRPCIAMAVLITGLAWSAQYPAQAAATADAKIRQQFLRLHELYDSGRMREFIAEAEREKARSPADIWLSRQLATAYGNIGEQAKAFAEIERTWQRSDVTSDGKFQMATAGEHIALGTRDRHQLVHWLTEQGRIDAAQQATYQRRIADLDQPTESLARLQARLRDFAVPGEQIGLIAPWLAYYGDSAGALEALRAEALVTGTVGASTSLWLEVYRDARRRPEFKQLLRDLELAQKWRTSGKWGRLLQAGRQG